MNTAHPEPSGESTGSGSGRGVAEALADALRGDPDTLRHELNSLLTEDDLPADAPLPDRVTAGQLRAAGLGLDLSRSAELELSGSLPAADSGLSRLQLFRLLPDRPGTLADESFPEVYAAAAARMAEAHIVVSFPDGREAHFGAWYERTLRLVLDQATEPVSASTTSKDPRTT